MCGILFSARVRRAVGQESGPSPNKDDMDFETLLYRLQVANTSRGPDAQNTLHYVLEAPENETGLDLTFFASELRLRGDDPIVQPHCAGLDGDVLCFNGEVFEGLDIAPHENDGSKLFSRLQDSQTVEQVRDCIGSIEGPYAFVFYQRSSRRVFFARDPLGRRSLLIHRPNLNNKHFLMTSVSVGPNDSYHLEELSTEWIHCLELDKLIGQELEIGFSTALQTIPRQSQKSPSCIYATPCRVNRSLPDNPPLLSSLDAIPDYLSQTVANLILQLDRSVMLQVSNIPQRSNEKGKSRVAVLFSGGIDSTVLAFLAHRHIPLDEPIDLLNVAFENPRKIQGNTTGVNKKKQRLEKIQRKAEDEQPQPSNLDVSYLVPDRVTGIRETEELRRLCPGRVWNFVEIDVPYKEYQAERSTVESLMFPGQTVMDLSLAMALYFASRGVGNVRSHPDAVPEQYATPARVLLNGLGSDELFGGYGRHRSAFYTSGWSAVIEELQLELDRIPTRNLGRDDRVISSHGKETRHPFLSLSFVNFVAQLPVQHKMDPRLDIGMGDKTLLRLAARKLGLIEASARKKRAMQFGSHSARMESGETQK